MIVQSNATQIFNNLWIGNEIIAKNASFMAKNNIKYVINISCDIPNYFNCKTYMNISVKDKDVNQDEILCIFEMSGKFIFDALNKDNGILVHCKQGNNKSASIITYFLVKYLDIDLYDAVQYLMAIRPNSLKRDSNFTKTLLVFKKSQ
ncbi:Dual specificity phosphatase, catalytic domain [seawater metagenome]|uniref:Dual specificity phosphatase, catalytic domain n=1 Tax=seawater metagenome TaxID=1561972 RepID=A0A5E8CMB3_9ZZZZ